MSGEIQFKVLDKVVAQGEQRLESMFAETFQDLEEARKRELSAEQQTQLDEVVEAYKLARDLVVNLIRVKDDIRLRMLSS